MAHTFSRPLLTRPTRSRPPPPAGNGVHSCFPIPHVLRLILFYNRSASSSLAPLRIHNRSFGGLRLPHSLRFAHTHAPTLSWPR
jgi:hypothetical protein